MIIKRLLTGAMIALSALWFTSQASAQTQECQTNCLDVVCPPDIYTNCTAGAVPGTWVTLPNPYLTNVCGGIVPTWITITCAGPSGQVTPGLPAFFPPGTNVVVCCTRNLQNPNDTYRDCCCFRVIVRNCPPDNQCEPRVTCPQDVVRCVTNQPGAIVDFPPPIVDNPCPGVTIQGVVYSMAPGSFFPVGTTTVSVCVRWTDAAGNSHQSCCCFDVTIHCCSDNCVDVLNCPTQVVTVKCGEVAPMPFFTNTCGQAVQLLCSPPAGTPLYSDTLVTCCLSNTVTHAVKCCEYQVHVVDTEKPVIVCPSNVTLTSPDCKPVQYQPPTPQASDNCKLVGTGCTPPPTGGFAVGVTTLTCCAWDAAGNTNCCSYTVTVVCCQDILVCPQQPVPVVSCGQPAPLPFYTNTCGQPLVLWCIPAAGTPLYSSTLVFACVSNTVTHAVKCCEYQVLVRDTNPPVINCPSNIFVLCAKKTATGAYGAKVNYSVTASDDCGPVTITCSPPPSSWFPEGCHPVACSATDAAGNTASCTFTVCVLRAGCYVKNPSFERLIPQPPAPAFCGNPINVAVDWLPLVGTPDLFRPAAGVPNNCQGNEKPCHGENYAGLEGGVPSSGGFTWEAMLGRTVAPLSNGKRFRLGACLSLAETSANPVYVEFRIANSANPAQNLLIHGQWVTNKVGWQTVVTVPACFTVPATNVWDAVIVHTAAGPNGQQYKRGYVYVDNVNICCCEPTLHQPTLVRGQALLSWEGDGKLRFSTNLADPASWQEVDGTPVYDEETGRYLQAVPVGSFFDVFFDITAGQPEEVPCPTCPQ